MKLVIKIELSESMAKWCACENGLIVDRGTVCWSNESDNLVQDITRVGETINYADTLMPDGLPEKYSVDVTNNNVRRRMVDAVQFQIDSITNKTDVPSAWLPMKLE
jgi:hypothetical protein